MLASGIEVMRLEFRGNVPAESDHEGPPGDAQCVHLWWFIVLC